MLIRDPVHGDIFFNKVEEELINTPELQRLRRIKQLGMVYAVYPGAIHTRFDHSLGTCYLTKRILAEMKAGGKIENRAITSEEEKAMTAAALLHDIGHLPFGHTLEDERRIFNNLEGRRKHDDPKRIQEILEFGEVCKILKNHQLYDLVCKLLITNASNPPRDFDQSKLWQIQLFSDTVCSDLLDYIKRDAYFIGISLLYDQRIFRYFSILNGKIVLETEKYGMERLDARSDIIHLLRCRCDLAEKVYLHHAVLAAGSMVAKAIELFGLSKNNILELLNFLKTMEDDLLLYFLKNNTIDINESISNLAKRVLERKLYKRAYVLDPVGLNQAIMDTLSQDYAMNSTKRYEVEEKLKTKLHLPKNEEVVIYCAGTSSFKEADVCVTRDGKPKKLSEGNFRDKPKDVEELTARYKDLWKLYIFVPREYVNKNTIKICEEEIGPKSRYSEKVLVKYN